MANPEIVSLDTAKASVGRGESDANVAVAWAAAEAYTWQKIRPWYEPDPEGAPPDPVPPAPGDLVQAVLLLTSRLIARRKSPDGMVGFDDFAARLASSDPDYRRLIGSWRKAVLA